MKTKATTQSLIDLITETWIKTGKPATVKTLAARSGLCESTINSKLAWLRSAKAFLVERGPQNRIEEDPEGRIFERAIECGYALGNGNQRTFEPRKNHLRLLLLKDIWNERESTSS